MGMRMFGESPCILYLCIHNYYDGVYYNLKRFFVNIHVFSY